MDIATNFDLMSGVVKGDKLTLIAGRQQATTCTRSPKTVIQAYRTLPRKCLSSSAWHKCCSVSCCYRTGILEAYFVIKNPGELTTELDPTSAAPLQHLKEQVLAAPGVQDFLKDLSGTRISLVLSGGGGKGAYQAGAMLALFDCGIHRFSALCGTSVGALNAAICHELCRLRDRGVVLRVWGEMSRQRVLRPSWLMLLKLLQVIAHGLHCLRHPASTDHPPNGPLEHRLRYSLDMANAEAPRKTIGRELIDILQHLLRQFLSRIIPALVVLLLMPLLVFGLAKYAVNPVPVLYFVMLSLAFVPLIMTLLFLALGKSASLFSNAALRSTINAIDVDAIRTSKTPIISTVALTRYPSFLEWTEKAKLLAHYEILSQMTSTEAVTQALLQSAALPEVFPERKVDGLWCVDGGLVDNTPILPAIVFGTSPEDRNTVIVLYLDPTLARFGDLVETERLRVRKIARRWEFLYTTYGQTAFSDILDRQFRMCRFISVIPSAHLGNLITGTMNFAAPKARTLVAMGYRDTLILIQRLGEQTVSR